MPTQETWEATKLVPCAICGVIRKDHLPERDAVCPGWRQEFDRTRLFGEAPPPASFNFHPPQSTAADSPAIPAKGYTSGGSGLIPGKVCADCGTTVRWCNCIHDQPRPHIVHNRPKNHDCRPVSVGEYLDAYLRELPAGQAAHVASVALLAVPLGHAVAVGKGD